MLGEMIPVSDKVRHVIHSRVPTAQKVPKRKGFRLRNRQLEQFLKDLGHTPREQKSEPKPITSTHKFIYVYADCAASPCESGEADL